MTKIFLHLYLFIVFTFIIFMLGVTYLPDYALKGVITDAIDKTSRGMFYLIEEELYKQPHQQWPKVIEELQPRYAYPLSILTLDDFNDTEKGDFEDGKVVHREVDRTGAWYHRIPDTQYVIAMMMGNTLTHREELAAKGTFSLAMDKFKGHSESEWQQVVDDLQKHFDVPVQILTIKDIGVEDKLKKRLQQGELVGVDVGEQTERYIQRIYKSQWFIQAGPIKDPVVLTILDYILYGLLALMMAVAVWAWVRPMWSGMNNLHSVVTAFGVGDFDVRANEHKNSPTYELAATFNAMAKRITSLIQTQKDLTNAVAHELRTPLARIRFATEMLEECDDGDRRRHLIGINHDISEMSTLVDELLLYAKFDQSGPKIEKKETELNTWLFNLNLVCNHNKKHVTIPLSNIVNEKHCVAYFDNDYLERALNNLVSNACRYASGLVEITTEYNDKNYFIHVDDDGPGVPGDSHKRLFEPFYRLDPSRDKGTGGYGLGLAIVKQIMLWHQGTVSVTESNLGGARFTMSFPIRKQL